MKETTVAVLGASNKPERYSFKALELLVEKGYRVIPVHPRLKEINGIAVKASLGEIREPVHTLTVYVGPARMEPLIDSVIRLKPGRVILNPGSESQTLIQRLDEAGIPWLAACTLIMLYSKQF